MNCLQESTVTRQRLPHKPNAGNTHVNVVLTAKTRRGQGWLIDEAKSVEAFFTTILVAREAGGEELARLQAP